MTEIAMDAGPRDEASAHEEVDDLLQRVREAVARSREVIQSSQEMLGSLPDSAPASDDAAN